MLPLLLITTVGSVLVTWLLPMAFNSRPPYGLVVDILVGTAAGLLWAYVAYEFVSPLIGLKGWLSLALSTVDAIGLAAVMLWVLRKTKG